jgi:hypothetical protein
MSGNYKLIWGQEYLLKNRQPHQRQVQLIFSALFTAEVGIDTCK